MEKLNINAHIGANVKATREQAGLNTEDLARMIGASAAQIEKIEAGTHRANAEILWKMAREMRVAVSVFYDGFDQIHKM